MQSMFRLPWSTESPGDKIMEKAVFHKPRPVPVVEIPFMSKLKRKRTDSPEPASAQPGHVVKRWKSTHGEVKPATLGDGSQERFNVVDGLSTAPQTPQPVEAQAQSPTPAPEGKSEPRAKLESTQNESAFKAPVQKSQKPAGKPESAPNNNTQPTMESSLTSAQQVIEAQFDYEILLKHNELRLIEQELAKCQIALEQLRRCSLIPYPGNQGLSENVSSGVGPALQPQPGYTQPQYAAPWGVTDGPYTRHYAKWLIPDPKFDSVPQRELSQQSQGYFGLGEGRATRGSFVEYPSSKARTSRTSTGTLKMPPLGESPAPTPKIDPLLHKRSTDGQWVRLYCAQCGHSNFSNTQGFLNHCRIKHNQVFKSHDAAAIACGVPVDSAEAGNSAEPSAPSSATATAPSASVPAPITPGIVHSLVRANPPETAKPVRRDFNAKSSEQSKPSTPGFTAASSTPSLNALLTKRGFTGNLKQLVDTARTPVDVDALENGDDEMADSAIQTPTTANPSAEASSQLVRLPVSAQSAAPARKASSRPASASKKGQVGGHTPRVPHPVFRPSSVHVTGTPSVHHLPHSPVDLSPNTVESNPGLVSDHDDEDDDDERSELQHIDGDIVMGDDVLVEDASDVEGAQERVRSRDGLGGCFENGEHSRKA